METKYVFLTSLLLTLAVFSVGLMLNYGLDIVRLDEVIIKVEDHKLNIAAYVLEKDFISDFGENKCQILGKSILDLRKEVQELGGYLDRYGSKSVFQKKGFEILKRKYFLLEIGFYDLITVFNKECGKKLQPVLFFYELEDDLSERQGYVLQDFADQFLGNVIILSFDIAYEDEPALNFIKSLYDVNRAPTIIFDENNVLDEFIYLSQLNNTYYKSFEDKGVDKYSPDMSFTFNANGVNISNYIDELKLIFSEIEDSFTKGDILLVMGRVTKNESMICESLNYYDNVSGKGIQKALAYESIAAIGCNRNKKAFYNEASKIWKDLGHTLRSEVNLAFAEGRDYEFISKEFDIGFPTSSSKDRIVLGDDFFKVNNDTLVSQVDRVTRDWLSLQYDNPYSENILTVFSERFEYDESELLPEIGWHEGARIKDLGLSPITSPGVLVKKFGEKWYASNLEGEFMFEIPKDKLLYPTTRFLRDDVAIIIDTHGVNMLVERAEYSNASLVIGCCDHVGKIKAAKYLSDKGVNVVCFTDKYLPLLLGQNVSVLGSPPINKNNDSVIIGNQSIEISSDDKILAMNLESDKFSISYYKTPTYYFEIFEKLNPSFNVEYFSVTDFNQMDLFTDYAELIDATVIAVRVFNSHDYTYVKEWLDLDNEHKVILFHSASYPYGVKLFKEYSSRVTFDDVNI